MSDLVKYSNEESVAHIQMGDGKNNLMSLAMLAELNEALDKAQKDDATLVLSSKEGVFCAGFDLKVIQSGAVNAFNMVIGGFQLSHRLLSHPRPVIIACPGHAIAMGAFLLLSADYRIASNADYTVVANEVEIGLTMPHSAITLCKHRLTPAHCERALLLSDSFTPTSAMQAGFFDTLIEPQALIASTLDFALRANRLNTSAHRETKLRARKVLLRDLNRAIWADRVSLARLGLRRLRRKN